MKREGKSKKIRISVQECNLSFCDRNSVGLSELLNSAIEGLIKSVEEDPLNVDESIYTRAFSVDFSAGLAKQ